MMQNASNSKAMWTDMAALNLHLERHFGVSRLKRGMLTMLAAWLGYFVVINMTVRTLNKMMVPWLDVPLGVFLVAQGTAVIFFAALILLVKTWGDASAR
jgi:uncharacterized membrane protein